MKVHKITEEYYLDVKRSLKNKLHWTRFTSRHIEEVAKLHGISVKTVMQIKNSDTYEVYVEHNKAQHPPQKTSLADDVIKLHELVFNKGGEYHKQTSAKVAVAQLLYELGKPSEA